MKDKKVSTFTHVSLFSSIYILIIVIMFLFVDTFDFYPNGYITQLNDNVLTINETNLLGLQKSNTLFLLRMKT